MRSIRENVHPQAIVNTCTFGTCNSIGPFTFIEKGAHVGSNCVIASNVFIERDARIGSNVVIGSGAKIFGGVYINDGVTIGANAVVGEKPEATNRINENSKTVIQSNVIIGANATVYLGVLIGRNATIQANSLITSNLPAYANAEANQVYFSGFNDSSETLRIKNQASPSNTAVIEGVDLVKFGFSADTRGILIPIELDNQLPFAVRRIFYVTDVPPRHIRGDHAHHRCHQLLVCIKGSLMVTVDNGRTRAECFLDSPDVGLHLHPRVWAAQWNHSKDSTLAVFASHPYDPDDYINDYEEFLRIVKN